LYKGIERSIWKGMSETQKFLLLVLILGITSLVVIQVFLRYVLHHPLMGIEEMLIFPVIWLYFLGAANASQERSQIQAQVIEQFLRQPKAVYVSKITRAVIALGIATWLTYWAYDYLTYSIHAAKLSATLYWPLVYAECAVLFGFLLMTIYAFVELADYMIRFLHILKNGKET